MERVDNLDTLNSWKISGLKNILKDPSFRLQFIAILKNDGFLIEFLWNVVKKSLNKSWDFTEKESKSLKVFSENLSQISSTINAWIFDETKRKFERIFRDKDRISDEIDNLTDLEIQAILEIYPEIKELILIKQIEENIDNIISDFILNNPFLTKQDTDILLNYEWPKAKNLIKQIVENPKISWNIIEFIFLIKEFLFTHLWGENIKSLNHILESILNSSTIPDISSVDNILDRFKLSISQQDFYAIISLFHDLKKSYIPAQYILDIKTLLWWKNLSSHQFDSASLFKSIFWSWVWDDFLELIDPLWKLWDKLPSLIECIYQIITSHWGNTEYIQNDTAVWWNRIINWVEFMFHERTYPKDESIEKQINYIEYKLAEIWIDNSEYVKLCSLVKSKNELRDLIQRFLLKKYLYVVTWKDLSIDVINIDEYLYLVSKLWFLNMTSNLEDIYSCSIERIIELVNNKVEILKNIWWLLNKYLHTRVSLNSDINEARFLFNIYDVSQYLLPSSESFIKLIRLNSLWTIISSPLNSSLSVLAEIKFRLLDKQYTKEEYDLYLSIYNEWLSNIISFIEVIKVLSKRKVNFIWKLQNYIEFIPKDIYNLLTSNLEFGYIYNKIVCMLSDDLYKESLDLSKFDFISFINKLFSSFIIEEINNNKKSFSLLFSIYNNE